jgi:ATP-dependent Clp protease ATP-binding subunit ClpC
VPFNDDPSQWARPIAPKRTLAYVDLPGRERVLTEAARALTGEPGSAAIIGPAGAGKGTVAREAARRLAASGWTVIEASSADAIAGLSYIGEIEGRLSALARDDGRVLWLLGDLRAALSAGTYRENPHGLVDRIVPLLAAGRLRLLAPCTPDDWDAVVRARPVLRTLIAPLRLEPANDEDTLRVAAVRLEELGTRMTPEALSEGLELARELLTTLAAPGHLLLLVTTATRRLTSHAPPEQLTRADLIPALSEITGLPADLLDERRPLDLAAVTRTFEERVLGQPEAVATLVERIALIKAGLTDPGRPLGVFLFTGPTGTGKTELAKTLARFLFGSADRLIRVDMSELQTPDDLDRLIGEPGLGGGDSLTSAIRRSPFAVVLLDEVEKAHPRAYDLFLQLFDDGRLTDRAGATADFRHAVVIIIAAA